MSRVILISPPYVDLYGKLDTAAGRYFPLGLGYIAAYLRTFGRHDVSLYEMDAQGLTNVDLIDIFRDKNPDIIGLTCSTPNFIRAIEIAKIARQYTQAKIVLGGVHASALAKFIMETYSAFIDYVVRGEGEITMLELVNACQNKTAIGLIQGLTYSNGKVSICNQDRPFIENLDMLPYPARDLLSQTLFCPNMHNARYRESFTILTSRGCPFNCSFCASRVVSGRKYRTHSAEYVLGEMEMLKKDYGAKQLIITDDTFTMNSERLLKICQGMIDKKLGLKWFCFSHINTINKEILVAMKKAGCYNIGFGVESAEPEILNKIGKRLDPGEATKKIKLANKLGFKTQAFYVFGTIGETKQQMERTICYAKTTGATLAFFNMLVPYPGTKDFQRYFSGVPLAQIKWDDFVAIGEHCVLERAETPPQEIERLIAKAYLQYYSDFFRIIMILFHIRTIFELKNYLKGLISLLKQIFNWLRRNNKGQAC